MHRRQQKTAAKQGRGDSAGVQERGERTQVDQAYLGGLCISADCSKAKRSLVNGARPMNAQKSDQLIVALKPLKGGGAKGLTDQQSPEAKHAGHRRPTNTWHRN